VLEEADKTKLTRDLGDSAGTDHFADALDCEDEVKRRVKCDGMRQFLGASKTRKTRNERYLCDQERCDTRRRVARCA
jgi:hypothetical protein